MDDNEVLKAATIRMTQEIGVAGGYDPNYAIRHDEFLTALRGTQAMRVYREMRENDPVIGGVMAAIELMLRRPKLRVEAADHPEGEAGAEFLEEVLDDMEHTKEETMSEIAGMAPFGFSLLEMVFKRRSGPKKDPTQTSQFSDGRIGLRKLAPRAQWTIDRFITDPHGTIEAVRQRSNIAGYSNVMLPYAKLLHFKTTSQNADPTGRSILRNAYISYHYIKRIQEFEAIAIERELNGLPVGKVPSDYLAATEGPKKLFVDRLQKILRDIRRNSQGAMVIPSDTYKDQDGKVTSVPLVEVELLTSGGSRDIDTSKVVLRHQRDMAASMLADFITLGQSERGSFALSKSKTELFLEALNAFHSMVLAEINRKMVPTLWALNGLPYESMPTVAADGLAPVDLEELGNFLRNLSVSGAPLFPDADLENVLRGAANLPEREENEILDDPFFQQSRQLDGQTVDDDETLDGESATPEEE